jgi:mycothiol synthase
VWRTTSLTAADEPARALTLADAPALARAYAAVEVVDRTGDHYSEQDVRDEMGDGDTLAVFGGEGEILAFARVHARGADRVQVDGAVLPAARGRGLGGQLLAWAEERARGLRAGAIRVDVHENNPGKEALVRSAGYEAVRREYRMTRALDEPLPDVAETPAGLTLASYAADLDDAVRRAHCEAFADHWGATAPDATRWAQSYTGMRAFRPDLSWLIRDGEEIVAYVLSYFWEADAAASGVREAFVGQLGVRPRWRRRGLGGLLLATTLRSSRAAGFERAVLGVDTANATGALGLYERAGFVVASTSVTWSKSLR